MKFTQAVICLILVISCNKKKVYDGPNNYFDDFEAYSSRNDLVDDNDQNWSFFHQTYSDNTIDLDTVVFHSGGQSVKAFAVKTTEEEGASKSSLNKQAMAFWEGDILSIDVWYFLEGESEANWLFILDIEENTAIGAGPGMRLALVNNRLLVEHKYPNPHIQQSSGNEINFPRNQWVNVRFEAKLSQKRNGYVKVWQDDILILEQNEWKTLPSDLLYFQQGTKGMYSKIEFGITANSHGSPTTMYVDDVDVKVLN